MSLIEQSKKGEHGELLAILSEDNGLVVSYFKKAKLVTNFNQIAVLFHSHSVRTIQTIVIHEIKKHNDELIWLNDNELNKSEILSSTI